jgi:TRAP-type mannitol/chloroaromatic compound transport system permease small subunit
MQAALRTIDRLSAACAAIAMILVLVLVAVMLNEVFSRYVLLRPRVFSLDLTFMTNGALFMLAAAYTLRIGGLIRIDFLSAKLPVRFQHMVNFAFFLLCMLPILGVLSYTGILRSWAAYQSGRRELASSWGPVVWPYYSALTIGTVMLWLQCIAETVRHAIGIRHPDRVPPPGATDATLEA